MSWVTIGLVCAVVSSTTAMRSGTSTCPGPPAGPTMMRPSTPIFITDVAADQGAFARGAHERALISHRHRPIVGAVGVTGAAAGGADGQRGSAGPDIDQRAIDLLRCSGDRLLGRCRRAGEEARDLVRKGRRARCRRGTGRGGGRRVPRRLVPEQPDASSARNSNVAIGAQRLRRITLGTMTRHNEMSVPPHSPNSSPRPRCPEPYTKRTVAIPRRLSSLRGRQGVLVQDAGQPSFSRA